jgi:hypothetical protein
MAEAHAHVPEPARSSSLPAPDSPSDDDLDLHAVLLIVEEQVRARPLLSVTAALALGFLAGRLLRS